MKKKKKDTSDKVLDAAEALFAQHGYDGTTTRQIASAAGISIQTLHYHGGNKLNLYSQVLQRSIVPVTKMINRHIENMMTGDLNDDGAMQESLEKLMDELLEVLHQNPNFPLLFFRQWLERDPSLRRVEWEQLVPFLRKWIKEVEGRVDAKRRRGIDLPLAFISLSFIYWGLFSNPVFIGKFLDLDPESPDYFERLKIHTKEVTSRILGRKSEFRSSGRKG
ncbi:MAG: TetR/AcrR family transcriptional regulator [Proteobacteria bacterium]|nr:TetR/AcrR family transcriptional regulator [Pseudomonadota bacterium]